MKKTTCVLLCLLLTIPFILSGCGLDGGLLNGLDNVDGNTSAQAVGADAAQTTVPPTVQPTLDAEEYGEDAAQLSIFKTGVFYFKGSITDSSAVTTPMEMACSGDSWYMLTTMQGISVGFLKSGDTYYMVYPEGECCLLMDEKACETLEMDLSDMDFDTSKIQNSQIDHTLFVESSDALLNAEIVTCNTYNNADGGLTKTYMKDGKLLRVLALDAVGNTTNIMDFEELSDVVSPEKLSPPAGFKIYDGATGVYSFMLQLLKTADLSAFSE